jgi:hypothetical protein
LTNLALSITASGISKIHSFNTTAYGDGSGELLRLIGQLSSFNGDISSVLSLLNHAIDYSERYMFTQNVAPSQRSLKGLESLILGSDISIANAVSSGLREVFSGWDRWIVSCTDGVKSRAFLAWFPRKEAEKEADIKARLDRCSLLWSCQGLNEWGVIVESVNNGPGNVYKKVGIAFVDTEHSGPPVDVTVI